MKGRRNLIDNIDQSLKNDIWLLARLARIKKMPVEDTGLKEIESVTQLTNPGVEGFYDDYSTPASWARIKSDVSDGVVEFKWVCEKGGRG